MTADPFAALATKAPAKKAAAPKAVTPKKETPVAAAPPEPVQDATPQNADSFDLDAFDGDSFAAFMASLGGDGVMEIGDEEFEAPATYIPYTMPPDDEWVPLVIVSAKASVKEMMIVLEGDTTLTPRPVPMPRIELSLEHASRTYGERGRAYLLTVPAFDVTLLTKRGTTFKKTSGRRLLAATGVVVRGQKLSLTAALPETMAILADFAEQMNGRTLLAQIRHVTKEYTDIVPVKDETGAFQYDPETNELIKTANTITRTFDNLKDDVKVLPDRGIEVDEEQYEITMETIARIAVKPVPPNTVVEAANAEGSVLAKWTGEEWVRHIPTSGAVAAVGSTDGFKG